MDLAMGLQDAQARLEALRQAETEQAAFAQRLAEDDEYVKPYEAALLDLRREESRLLARLAAVRQDVQSVQAVLARARTRRDTDAAAMKRHYATVYQGSKDAVDALRQRVGMSALPSLQQAEEQQQQEYLTRRRRVWKAQQGTS